MGDDGKEFAWEDDPLWYKDAIIYQLHIKAFFDSNDDGTGDFKGLKHKLDYIQDLGVNAIWLLPFYPSPLKDDGYDIADYRNIHPAYGTLKDFKLFVREAHKRGLKVITELVINHTSDQHPWYLAARKAPPGSRKREFYVWSDTDTRFAGTRIIFTDTEQSNWEWDPVAKAYYWHRFFSHQPDLNHNNPQVVKAVTRVMQFWLDFGVDGMRLDAIPYLCVREGTNNENLPETHDVIRQIRAAVDAEFKNRMLLAEANQWPEDVRDYFGDGDECHMAYHFPLMPRIFMAVAQEDRHPITEIMRQTPDIPETCQWAIFLRNHDELTLEMVTDRERDYMYQIYSADPRMRVNVGIRRRLAPLMDNDHNKIKLLNSLLMSMPGTPILYYGDEIGMGDNIYLGDRNAVRTPMQWTPDRNAGFSKADPQKLYLPPIMDPIYGYEAVNVESQARNPSSLLNWTKHLIAVRKTHQGFGRGRLRFLRPGNRKILAYLREYQDDALLCVANLARTAQPVELDLASYKGRIPVELIGQTPFPPVGELPYLLTLPGHGFYWFKLEAQAEQPAWHEERLPPLELPVLVLFNGWRCFFPEEVDPKKRTLAKNIRKDLETEILPTYLPAQRWFAAKGESVSRVELHNIGEWAGASSQWLLGRAQVQFDGAPPQNYFLPLSIAWEDGDEEHLRFLLTYSLTKVRQHAQVGLLYDAFAEEGFCWDLVRTMKNQETVDLPGGKLRFSSTSALEGRIEEPFSQWRVRRPTAEGTNTTVILGDRLFLKGYRQMQEGQSPEKELGWFLTEVSPFPNVVPLAGSLDYEDESGRVTTLALLQGYVKNQGDAWSYTLEYLGRFLEDCLLKPDEIREHQDEVHRPFLLMMHTLGRRTGELHKALAVKTRDRAFKPEPVRARDLKSWSRRVRDDATKTLTRLRKQLRKLPDPAMREPAQRLVKMRARIQKRIRDLVPENLEAFKTRYHGDYHLGQVLLSENDFTLIDFEGEPARSLAERRRKHSPLRDVAGMIRSFNYAAYAALFKATINRPQDLDVIEPFAKDWQTRATTAFMEGYIEGVEDCRSFPKDPDHAQNLIDLFTLEKALYELRYELDNRPDWIGIPLRGLLELVDPEKEDPPAGG